MYVLFSITYLGSFAQSAGPIEKYVGEYYQYMNTLNAPKPDIEVLNEIINRVNIKTGERFIIDEVVSTPGKSKRRTI